MNLSIYQRKAGCAWSRFHFHNVRGWFHGSNVLWKPTVRDNSMWYLRPLIPMKVTVTCNILNHTPNYCIFHLASIVVYNYVCLTEHVNERISTEDSEYGSTWWPIWLTTMRWRQVRITGYLLTCHSRRLSICEIHESILLPARVWLPSFTVVISWRSKVLSLVSIQHNTQFAIYQQHKPRISKLWATMAWIWSAPRWLCPVTNVLPSAVPRPRAVISWWTKSATRTARKSWSQSANIFQLDSSTSTSFPCTWKTPHKPPDEKIWAANGTA